MVSEVNPQKEEEKAIPKVSIQTPRDHHQHQHQQLNNITLFTSIHHHPYSTL